MKILSNKSKQELREAHKRVRYLTIVRKHNDVTEIDGGWL